MRRRLALLICRGAAHLLRGSSRIWGSAITAEIASIDDDGEALAFAVSSVRGLIVSAADQHLRAIGAFSEHGGGSDMEMEGLRLRAIGMACGTGAVLLGIAHMAAAGAPTRYLLLNAAALAIGLVLVAMILSLRGRLERWSGGFVLACGLALLATALFGDRAEGAARWVTIGAVFVQPSLVLLPAAIMTFARAPNRAGTCGMLAAALALALQPDRSMAAMMFLSMVVLVAMRPGRGALWALGASMLSLAVTLARADTLKAVPYVDQIFYSAFDVHPAAGLAVLTGAALLVLPAVMAWFGSAGDRTIPAMFTALWLTAIAAAALGNYPTPLVGYGGSAVIGYLLSVAGLSPRRVARGTVATEERALRRERGTGGHLRRVEQPA